MKGVRPIFLPPLPWVSYFSELNVRTYVKTQGKPGVYFFSLDAGNRIIVEVARKYFHLPYLNADIHFKREGIKKNFIVLESILVRIQGNFMSFFENLSIETKYFGKLAHRKILSL